MKVLITGGAGFIGCNTAKRLVNKGWDVVVLDNLSRKGSETNLEWLGKQANFEFKRIDVRDAGQVDDAIANGRFGAVIHLAAQVAVTTSMHSPRQDFEINVLGTFNVLEAIRRFSPETILLNASTNKVYGRLDNVSFREDEKSYAFTEKINGVDESQPLDFHSPYGCSKGAADQYVHDYARIFGLRCVNFRQSCIYGYRQFGIEDQGWVAWFIIAHLLGRPLTIYGNGKQVRDILFVEDLVDLYESAIAKIDSASGHTFNIGGGIGNTTSLIELIEILERLSKRKVTYSMTEWSRPGDQPIYISDIRLASSILGWKPNTSVAEGVGALYKWITDNKVLFT